MLFVNGAGIRREGRYRFYHQRNFRVVENYMHSGPKFANSDSEGLASTLEWADQAVNKGMNVTIHPLG